MTITINSSSFTDAFNAADTGPFLQGLLIPLNKKGQIRVTYNWLYSALNCVSDDSDFLWNINKESDTEVSLSPTETYQGLRVYASVRPDYDYRVQVQAPFSADWITAVGSDEKLTFSELGFFNVTFKGLNGKYLSVNSGTTTHVDANGHNHTGYQIVSNGDSSGDSTTFFVAPAKSLQSNIDVPLITDIGENQIARILQEQDVPDSAALAQSIYQAATRL